FSPPISWSQQTPPYTAMPGPTASATIRASCAVGSVCDFSRTPAWPASRAWSAASSAVTERPRCASGPKWPCRSTAAQTSTATGLTLRGLVGSLRPPHFVPAPAYAHGSMHYRLGVADLAYADEPDVARRAELAREDGFAHVDVLLAEVGRELALPVGCPIA